MSRRKIAMGRVAADAAAVLGQQIRLARAEKNWTAAELAERAGVSPRTVLAIEAGEPTPSLGNVFNVAVLAGVPLFDIDDPSELAQARRRGESRLKLLPSKVYHPTAKSDDGQYNF